MLDTEFELWSAVVNGPHEWGRLFITPEHISELRRFSGLVNGWVVFDDVQGETYIPLPEWIARYTAWESVRHPQP